MLPRQRGWIPSLVRQLRSGLLQLREVQSKKKIIKAARRHTAEPGPTLMVRDTEADS